MRMVVLAAILVLQAGWLPWLATVSAQVQVTVDQGVQHQTILGWGGSLSPIEIPESLRNRILDELVDDLGLTRARISAPSGNKTDVHRWEWTNDNGDPNDINWSAFNTTGMDKRVTDWIAPFKQRVEARGDPCNLYVSPSFFDGGSSGAVPAWLLNSPGEYAEFAISLVTYLRDTYCITPDFYCILNEPGNHNPFTSSVVGKAIKALGPRLQSLGLTTKIEFPECLSANRSWDYIQSLQNDSAVWPHVGLLSYHLYGSNSSRPNIRDFGIARGIPTAQTELLGATINTLYDDMTLGGVSFWEHYVFAYFGSGAGGVYLGVNYNLTSFTRSSQYWNYRQVMHYVRPGAVRVETTSDDSDLRPLAYMHNGLVTLVLLNNREPYQARTVNIAGLVEGTYGVCCSVGSGIYDELGLESVGAGGTLTVDVAADSILTVYPYPGTNQAPVVTDWKASPDYLTLPASSTTLSASATDPETDSLSYLWTVTSQPGGAAANLATPNAASTGVSGLTVAGEYVFDIAVYDLTHTVHRQVHLMVFADNQPPVLDDVHNRNPVLVTLPTSSTELRAGGRDLEGDSLSYQWSIVSQPPGANANLDSPTSSQCSVSNLTMAGDYEFRIQLSDPTHTVEDTLTVPVYPVNTAPVIVAASATPDELILPAAGIVQLSATTNDPDGDVISHWWSVKSAPSGAEVVIAQQAAVSTQVTGLIVEGTYVFTLTVVDRTEVTTQDVTVIVRKRPGDYDIDTDVDQVDFGHFQACLTGPVDFITDSDCFDADFNADNHVDANDLVFFLGCYSGSGIIADPNCTLP